MAELATIARPYAEAAFRVAKAGNLGAWSELMSELSQVANNPDMQAVAGNPNVSTPKLVELFESALKSPLNSEAKNFINTVIANHRLTVLPEIAAQFHALKNANDGSADVEITSAFPLEGAQLNELVTALEHKFGKKLVPSVTVDSSLIGGVMVKVGDAMLDTSVRARLEAMRTALTA